MEHPPLEAVTRGLVKTADWEDCSNSEFRVCRMATELPLIAITGFKCSVNTINDINPLNSHHIM
jgi:hypothetical protein